MSIEAGVTDFGDSVAEIELAIINLSDTVGRIRESTNSPDRSF